MESVRTPAPQPLLLKIPLTTLASIPGAFVCNCYTESSGIKAAGFYILNIIGNSASSGLQMIAYLAHMAAASAFKLAALASPSNHQAYLDHAWEHFWSATASAILTSLHAQSIFFPDNLNETDTEGLEKLLPEWQKI